MWHDEFVTEIADQSHARQRQMTKTFAEPHILGTTIAPDSGCFTYSICHLGQLEESQGVCQHPAASPKLKTVLFVEQEALENKYRLGDGFKTVLLYQCDCNKEW